MYILDARIKRNKKQESQSGEDGPALRSVQKETKKNAKIEDLPSIGFMAGLLSSAT